MARMAAAKLRAPAPAAAVALLLATCLVVSTTVASARPLKPPPSSSAGDDVVRTVVVESPAGDIQTVVGAAEHDGSRDGHTFVMSIDMLAGIKDSGPSPGAGH